MLWEYNINVNKNKKGELFLEDELCEINEIIFVMNSLILLLIIRKEAITNRHGMRVVK